MSLRLGLFYPNALSIHVMSAEVTAANLDLLDFDTHRQVARAAEEIGLDYMFLADAWGPFGPKARAARVQDPVLLSPLLGMHLLASTTRIRCITTVHTTWFHPLVVARMGAALDAMSKGRWGINIVTGSGFAEYLDPDLFGRFSHDERYEYAEEIAEVLTQAWSQDRIEFDGKHLHMSGQLVGPFTAQQKRPLIVSAGASDAGRQFAGRYADYIFMPGRTPQPEIDQRLTDIRRIASGHGRAADAVKLQMHASIVVREKAEEAKAISDWVADNVDLGITAEYLNAVRGNISTYDEVYRSLGDLNLRQVGSVAGARKIHGSADEVAEHIEMLHRKFGCDGIAMTLPVWKPEEIRRLGALLLPRLRRMGIWQHPESRDWSW
jgi:FMNH2-dependent dimethyl sulfone monooxygenase